MSNLEELQQTGSNAFTRVFDYTVSSGVKVDNKLDGVTIGSDAYSYTYDVLGNILTENSNRHYLWDGFSRLMFFKNQVGSAEPSIEAQYLYDSGGNRVKKIVRKQGGDFEITVYIDGLFEYHTDETDEQNTVHIMDDKSRIAIVRIGDAMGDSTPWEKYVLENNIGSSMFLLDENAAMINEQEYYPFGETSFGSYGKKKYQYCGKERDEESGLYYYGARFYAPWTCRFISVDPLAADYPYLTPYNYAGNKPITHKDIDGLQSTGDQKVESGGGGSLPPSGNGQVIPESKKISCHNAQQAKDLLETKEVKTDNIKPNEPVKLSDKEVEAIKAFIKDSSKMNLSKEGLEFIKTSEGGFRSKVYDAKTGKNAKFDKGGNIIGSGDWTIGYGHKLTSGEIKDKSFNGGIKEEQGEALLLKDVSSAVNKINKSSEGSLTQSQFDALVSFAYQQGIYNKSLSKVMALVNAGKISEAATQIQNTGNKVHRREAEATMFSKGLSTPSVLSEPRLLQNEVWG